MQLNTFDPNTIAKNTLFQNTFNKTPIATSPIKFNIIEKTPLITKAFSAIPTTTNPLPYQTLYKAQEAREHLPESWAQKYLQNRFKQLNYTAPKNYINNRNDPMQMNSLADYIWKDIVGGIFGIDNGQEYNTAVGKWGAKIGILGWLIPSFTFGGPLRTITSTIDWAWSNYLDPLAHGKFGAFGLNILTDLSETGDILANPTKGLLFEGGEGFLKSIGATGEGRKNYDYDTGFFLSDLALEIITDPSTYIPFLGWLAKGAGLAGKAGVKVTTELGEEIVKQAAKEVSKETAEQVSKEVSKEVAEEIAEQVSKEVAGETSEKLGKEVAEETVEQLTRKAQIVNEVAARSADKKFSKALKNINNYSDEVIESLPKLESLDNETRAFAEALLDRSDDFSKILDDVGQTKAKRIAGDIAQKAITFKKAPLTDSFITKVFNKADSLFVKHQAKTYSEALIKAATQHSDSVLKTLGRRLGFKGNLVNATTPESIAAFVGLINSAEKEVQARTIIKGLRKIYTITNPILEAPDKLIRYGLGTVSGIMPLWKGLKATFHGLKEFSQTRALNKFIKEYKPFKITNAKGEEVFDIFKYEEIGQKALHDQAQEVIEQALDPTAKEYNKALYGQAWADTLDTNLKLIQDIYEANKDSMNTIPTIRQLITENITNVPGITPENVFEKYIAKLERINKDANGIFKVQLENTIELFKKIQDLEEFAEVYFLPNQSISFILPVIKFSKEDLKYINDTVENFAEINLNNINKAAKDYGDVLNNEFLSFIKTLEQQAGFNKEATEKIQEIFEYLSGGKKITSKFTNLSPALLDSAYKYKGVFDGNPILFPMVYADELKAFFKSIQSKNTVNNFIILNHPKRKTIDTLIISSLIDDSKSSKQLVNDIVKLLQEDQKIKLKPNDLKSLKNNINKELSTLRKNIKTKNTLKENLYEELRVLIKNAGYNDIKLSDIKTFFKTRTSTQEFLDRFTNLEKRLNKSVFDKAKNNLPEVYKKILTKNDFKELYEQILKESIFSTKGVTTLNDTPSSLLRNFIDTQRHTTVSPMTQYIASAEAGLRRLLTNKIKIPTNIIQYKTLLNDTLSKITASLQLEPAHRQALTTVLLRYLVSLGTDDSLLKTIEDIMCDIFVYTSGTTSTASSILKDINKHIIENISLNPLQKPLLEINITPMLLQQYTKKHYTDVVNTLTKISRTKVLTEPLRKDLNKLFKTINKFKQMSRGFDNKLPSPIELQEFFRDSWQFMGTLQKDLDKRTTKQFLNLNDVELFRHGEVLHFIPEKSPVKKDLTQAFRDSITKNFKKYTDNLNYNSANKVLTEASINKNPLEEVSEILWDLDNKINDTSLPDTLREVYSTEMHTLLELAPEHEDYSFFNTDYLTELIQPDDSIDVINTKVTQYVSKLEAAEKALNTLRYLDKSNNEQFLKNFEQNYDTVFKHIDLPKEVNYKLKKLYKGQQKRIKQIQAIKENIIQAVEKDPYNSKYATLLKQNQQLTFEERLKKIISKSPNLDPLSTKELLKLENELKHIERHIDTIIHDYNIKSYVKNTPFSLDPFEDAFEALSTLKQNLKHLKEHYVTLNCGETNYSVKLEQLNSQTTLSDAYTDAFNGILTQPIINALIKINPEDYIKDSTAYTLLTDLQLQIKNLQRLKETNNVIQNFNQTLIHDGRVKGIYNVEQVRALRSTLQKWARVNPKNINDPKKVAKEILENAKSFNIALDIEQPLSLDYLQTKLKPEQLNEVTSFVKDSLDLPEDFTKGLAHTGAQDVVMAAKIYKENDDLFREINELIKDDQELVIIMDLETGGTNAATDVIHDVSYYIPSKKHKTLKAHVLSKDSDAYTAITKDAKTINDRSIEFFDKLHDKSIRNTNYNVHSTEADLLDKVSKELEMFTSNYAPENVHIIFHNGKKFDVPYIQTRNRVNNIPAIKTLFGTLEKNSKYDIIDSLEVARVNSNYVMFSKNAEEHFIKSFEDYIEKLKDINAKGLTDIDNENVLRCLNDLVESINSLNKNNMRYLEVFLDRGLVKDETDNLINTLQYHTQRLIAEKNAIKSENELLKSSFIPKSNLTDPEVLKSIVETLSKDYKKLLIEYKNGLPKKGRGILKTAVNTEIEDLNKLIKHIEEDEYVNLTQLLNVFRDNKFIAQRSMINGEVKYVPIELIESTPHYGSKKLEHDDIIDWFINPTTGVPFKDKDKLTVDLAQDLSKFSLKFKKNRETIVSEAALSVLDGYNNRASKILECLINFVKEGIRSDNPLFTTNNAFNRVLLLFNPDKATTLSEKVAAILTFYNYFDNVVRTNAEKATPFYESLKKALKVVDTNLSVDQISAFELFKSKSLRTKVFKTNQIYSTNIRRRYIGQLRGIANHAIDDTTALSAKGLLEVDDYTQRVYTDLLDLADSTGQKCGFKAASTAVLTKPSVDAMKAYLDMTLKSDVLKARISIGQTMEAFTNDLALQELKQVVELDDYELLCYFAYQTPLPYFTFGKQDLTPEQLAAFMARKLGLNNLGIEIIESEDRIYTVLTKRLQHVLDTDTNVVKAYLGDLEIIKKDLKELDFKNLFERYKETLKTHVNKNPDIADSKINEFFNKFLTARTNIIELSDKKALGTINNILTVEAMTQQYDVLPDTVKALLPDIEDLKKSLLFKNTVFDKSNLGSTTSRHQINEFVNANYLTTLTHTTEYAADRASDTTRILSLYYDSNLSISNGIYQDLLKEEGGSEVLRKYLIEHPEYVLTALVEDTKHGGYKAIRINPYNKKAIEAAVKLDAVILPDETFRTLVQTINYNILQDDKLSILNRLVYMYKTGFLALSPGVIMRNIMDGMLKNLVATKDVSVLKDQFIAADLWRRYSEASEDILKMHNSGLDFTESLDTYFKKSTAKLTREEYDFVDHFSRTSASASLSDSFKKFYIKKNTEQLLQQLPTEKAYKEFIQKNRHLNQTALNEAWAKELGKINKPTVLDTIWTNYVKGTEFLMSPMTTTEQWFRLGEYINLLKHGATEQQALYKVISTHFDYSSKTNAARLLELVIPFYNYKMANLNFWAEQLSKNAPIRALFVNVLQELANMDQVSNEDLKYNRSLTYFLTSGNIDLSRTILGHTGIFGNSEEANMSLKTSFSFMDAANLLMNPIESIKGSLISPLQTAVNYGLYAMKDKLPEGAKEVLGVSDNMLNTTRTSLTGETTYYTPSIAETILNNLPIIGAVKQRYGTLGPKYASKTGSILPQILPDVFGSINKTKSFSPSLSHTYHPTHTTQPTSYTPSPKRTYPTKSYPTKAYPTRSYPTKSYAKKTYAKKAYAKKTYAKKTYAKKAYPKRSYANINYTNNYTPGLFARTRQFTPNKYKPNYSGILFNSSKLGYKSLFYKNFYYKHYTKKGKRYMDMRTAKYTPRNLRFKILATNKLFA